MQQDVKDLIEKFEEIRKIGWVKSVRAGSSGVGMTFEKLLGVSENRLAQPDYKGIEIKTKRNYSKSYTTLFNCAPLGSNLHEVERLKDTYGYPDSVLKTSKVINNSIFANCLSWVGSKFIFKLQVDRKAKKVFLYIFDSTGKLLEKNVYWSFAVLQEKLYRKVNMIAFISAIRKFYKGDEFFKYYKMSLYKLKSFDLFIDLLERGIIRVTFKLGVIRNGERIGMIHDHGTGFEIKESDLPLLYDQYC